MALQVTNELIDELQRMSDPDVANVYNALDDSEKIELSGAVDARWQGRLVGTPAPVEEAPNYVPNRSLGQPAEPKPITTEDVIRNAKLGLTPRGKPNPVAQAISQADYSMAPGKMEMMNKAVELGQETVGKPVAGTIIEAMPEVSSPSAKVLGRDLLTRIAGPSIQDYAINPEVKKQGVETLAKFGKFKVGPVESSAGDVARGVTTMVGDPTTYIGLGWGAAGEKMAAEGLVNAPKILRYFGPPVADVLAVGAEQGLIQGGIAVATDAPNKLERATYGALAGMALRSAGKLGHDLVSLGQWSKGKVVDMLTSTELKGVVQRMEPDGVNFRTFAQAQASQGETSLTLYKPIVAMPVTKADGVYGRIVFQGNIVEDVPFHNTEAAIKFHQAMEEKGITDWALTREEFARILEKNPDVESSAIAGRSLKKVKEGTEEIYGQEISWDEYIHKHVDKRPYPPDPDSGTRSLRVADSKGRVTAKVDEVPAPSRDTGVLIIQNPDGSHTFEKISRTLIKAHNGNYQAGDKVAAVVEGNTSAVGQVSKMLPEGKVEVTLPTGTKHVVENFNVRSATEKEVLEAATQAPKETPEINLATALTHNPHQRLEQLAAHAGMDVSSTRDLLGKMEDSKQVVHDGHGEWNIGPKVPKLLPPPKAVRPPPEPGDLVHIMGRNGEKKSQVVRLDPDGKHVYVKFDQSSLGLDRVPLSQVRNAQPPGIASLRGVIPESPKLDGPLPDAIPWVMAEEMKSVHALMNQFTKIGNKLEPFMKHIESQRHHGPLDAQRYIKEGQAAQQFMKDKALITEMIQKSVPKGTQGQFFRDVHSLAEGHLTAEDMGQKYPDIWNAAREKVQALLDERTRNDKILAEHGVISEEHITAREEGMIDLYVARKFRSHLDTKNWAKKVPAAVKERAKEWLKADQPDAFWTDDDLDGAISKILNTDDPIGGFLSSKVGKKYANALKTRKDIPAPIRELMGEITNGSLSLAETIGNQRAIIQNLNTWRAIAADERYFSPGPRNDPYGKPMVQVPFDKKRFGVAAGGFVQADLLEGLQDVAKTQGQIARFMSMATGYVKGNEVSTLKAIWNSTIGNVTSSIFMGKAGINLQTGASDLRMAWKAIRAYDANPTDTGLAALVKEAVTYGAHWSGQMENELRFKKAFAEMDEIYGELPKSKGQKALGVLELLGSLPYKGVRKWQGAFGTVLDANDAVFRLANYISARRHYLGQINEATGLPHTLEQAARAASKDINDCFWNAQHVGKLVEAARSNGAGLVAKYLTAYTDEMRIWKNMAKRLATKPDTRGRVLGWGAAVAGAAVYMGATNGDDDLGGEDNFTKRTKSWSPFMVKLPFTDTNGSRVFYDMTTHFGPARFMQGHPDDALWRRVVANLITQPLEGGTLEEPATEFLEKTGLIRPFAKGRGAIEGDTGLWKTLEYLQKMGAVPKLPGNIAKEISKTQPTGIYPAQQGVGTAIARTIAPVIAEPPTALPTTMEFVGEIEKLKGDMATAAKTGRQDLIPGIVERIQFLGEQQNQQRQK